MSFLTKLQEEGLKGRASLRKTTTIVTDASGRRKNESTGAVIKDQSSQGFVVDTKPDPGLYECIPNLFIGSEDAAMNLEGMSFPKETTKKDATTNNNNGEDNQESKYYPGLLDTGITHVINLFSQQKPFEHKTIVYRNATLLDIPEQSLTIIYDEVLPFIDVALQDSGKVLVHCNAGVSRASSVIIAYLIKYRGMSYKQALEEVRKNRPSARPNAGFATQLKELEKKQKLVRSKDLCSDIYECA